jgi:endonuclease-3 related protein
MIDATTLFKKLKSLGYDNNSRDDWWWPNSGSFEVVIGAILTQNTTWENVEKSLNNLKNYLTLETFASLDINILKELIKPSGFYNQKAKYLKLLSENILNEFGDFDYFKSEVTREWLLNQKGIGFESADAILNYACYKEAFVVDSYTNRLLKEFGFEFESYRELQEWIVDSFYSGYKKVFNFSRAKSYARAHGMVVEYCKKNRVKNKIDITELLDG